MVRDNGGHAVALSWSMKNLYGVGPGDVFWAASDMGWVVGHSYIVYGPLLAGATTVIYEGKPVGTPDAGAFWRVVEQHRVKVLFTAPTAIRAIRRDDPEGDLVTAYDLSSLEALFLAGERLDPDTYHWATDVLGIPVIDHWWQTETGWAICADCRGLEDLPLKPGSPTKPVPGFDLAVLDAHGSALEPPAEGVLALRLPLPPGTLPTLWQNDEGFVNTYLAPYPGYYFTGDNGSIDEDGYVFVMGRVDDIINVAGHRLSTGRMEEVLAQHADVAECAVIGAADDLKGQVPLGLRGAQGRRRQGPGRGRRRAGAHGQGARRPGGGVQARRRRAAPAQDALGQDPARHDPQDRRRRRLQRPRDDRGPDGHPGARGGLGGSARRGQEGGERPLTRDDAATAAPAPGRSSRPGPAGRLTGSPRRRSPRR